MGGRGGQAWLPGKSENKRELKHFVNLVDIRYLGIFANLNILEYFKAGDIESFNKVSESCRIAYICYILYAENLKM